MIRTVSSSSHTSCSVPSASVLGALSDDDIRDGWSEQALFRMIASLLPGARAVLRQITELGGTASSDEVQQYFADRPTTPIAKAKIGGILTSIQAVQRASARLLQRGLGGLH